MGWFLLRKPYPGFQEEDRIDIKHDVILLGRGRECSKHCLSIFVSRRHLQLIPKDDGTLNMKDLNSSNGTFVNQAKIDPNIEWPLKVGDEIGIGHVTSLNEDCYVYQVHLQDDKDVTMSAIHHQSSNKEHDTGDQNNRHHLERGLKRFPSDPDEIVLLDDDDDETEGTKLPVKLMSHRVKRPRPNDTSTMQDDSPEVKAGDVLQKAEVEAGDVLLKAGQFTGKETSACLKEEDSGRIQDDSPELKADDVPQKAGKFTCKGTSACLNEEDSGRKSTPKAENLDLKNVNFKENLKPPVKALEFAVLSHKETLDTNQDISNSKKSVKTSSMGYSACPAPTSKNAEEHGSYSEERFKKATNRRLSALLDENCDSSSSTVKLSSPIPVTKGVSMPLCSTPNPSKQVNLEEVVPFGPSVPYPKSETRFSSISKGADMSPIVKEMESRHSDSSFNYTLDEEMIPIDVSDDDEIFPCSQMFVEDVKPCIQDLPKEVDFVDLSLDENSEADKVVGDDDSDGIIVLGSSDEDEDDIEDANRWFKRLSQSSIKVEVDDVDEQREQAAKEELLLEVANEDLQTGLSKDPYHPCDDDIELVNVDSRQQLALVDETGAVVDDTEEKELKLEEKLKSKTVETREQKHHQHRSKRKKKEKEREKPKDRDKKQGESKSHKHKKRHSKHESRRKREKSPSDTTKTLKTFADISSDDEPCRSPQHLSKDSSASPPAVTNTAIFDDLMKSYNESIVKEPTRPLERKENVLTVYLDRLENDPELCEQYGLPSSSPVPLPSSSVSAAKKISRKIELVEALPNPPRKAFNRGISITNSMKIYNNDKSVDRRSTHDLKTSKPPDIKDTKTIRKEKLAQVAALRASKEKESSEAKRAAPARVKNTETNRGSFLTEGDGMSSLNKLKSRIDIIKSSKIPKVKDKVAPSYPSKSPLEGMNMSWEKEKPVASNSSSAPSHEPIEIPTGPQPKRRVAQVPPQGFYRDSSPLPETSAPTMKSCLASSSKHNIALNKSKPNKIKKKVRFKENLEEVFLIDSIPNRGPVNSYKDADRPNAMAMSQVSSAVIPRAMVMPNDETILLDVIYDICKWNPLWLKEEKNLPADTLPPVVSNMSLPTIPRTEFLDFQEYHSTMYPLLMLELWNGVSKEYNHHLHDSSKSNMIMAVDNASSSAVAPRSDRMLTTLNCHMPVYERDGKVNYPRRGSLVMIDLRLKDFSGKPVMFPVFGYVAHDCKDKAYKNVIFHKDLVSKDKLPAFKLRFSLLIRERKNLTYMLEKPMQIKNVKYIRGDLRVFVAMKNLQYMPLRYSIISPNAGNEDMSLPNVSGIKLQLPEQLNPTQEKTVLQTAEVCQQHKPKICLIQGPPGTGKSHVIASLVLQLLYRDQNYTKANREKGFVPKILLCAPSNTAVDVLVKRLLRKRSKMEKQHRFKMVRVGNDEFMNPDVKGISLLELTKVDCQQKLNSNDNIQSEMSNLSAKLETIENTIANFTSQKKTIPEEFLFRKADYLRKLKVLEDRQKQQSKSSNSNESFAVRKESMKKILRGADIVATTLSSCVINIMETVFPPTNQNIYNFPVCIVDEATQCLEVETLIPLMLGVKTLVLVGDHNQLPATVLSKAAKEKGLGTSLFARLQKVVPDAVQILDTQYRMHPEILRWPNKYFYNSSLKTPDKFLMCRESKIRPYTVVSLPFQQDLQRESNLEEAKLVLLLAELLVEKAILQQNFRIGIVTPYRSQFYVLKERLGTHLTEMVEVNTIDSYQGQEKDIIIFSCVRTSGVGFLSDRQRLNVALTRAKYGLFICGNFSSLDRDSMWNNLLTDARQRKCVLELRSHQWNNKEELWNLIKRR